VGVKVDPYQSAASYVDRIERELRSLNVWQSNPPADEAFESETAFFADTMSFYQWLQFVLLPRVQEIVGKRGALPQESSVGAYAVRELDGVDEASGLIQALCEFDEFIEGPHSASGKRQA
jgi:uncharacterized protein YqcC (DUF446 family)